jgi:hypothetical protein
MSTEIEGEVRELHEERAVVLAQPGQALVSRDRPTGPAEMVAVASQLATILKDIVDRQKLFATISNKRYPTVEAWMTIARMDNVVAREAQPPLRHDDGSYEGFAELIRLSDGMIIGRASALCGTQGDSPGISARNRHGGAWPSPAPRRGRSASSTPGSWPSLATSRRRPRRCRATTDR